MRPAVHVAAALSVMSACSSDGETSSAEAALRDSSCFVGDAALEPVIELVYRTASGEMETVGANARVPLIQPPQGGKVMFIGVRAQNLDGCPLLMSSALREPGSDVVVALERRPVLLDPMGDGWLGPKQPRELSNYSNLPACPRANLDRRIDGEPYSLYVSVEDSAGRRAETTVTIEPTCGEPERLAQCRCECSTDYTLGGECAP